MRKAKNADPTDLGGISVSVGDLTLYVPLLNTEGSEFTQLGGVDAIRTSGATNLARIDVDADFLASILFGLPPAGVNIALGPSLARFEFAADLLDMDVGALFKAEQLFSLAAEVQQTLELNHEVNFRVGDGAWQIGSVITVALGETVEVEIDPTLDFAITPVYTLASEFSNQTRLLMQPVFEVELLRFDVDAPFPLPDPNEIALATFLKELGVPLVLPDLFNDKFALAGFAPIRGATLSIAAIPLPGALVLFGSALLAGIGLRSRTRQLRRDSRG